MLRLSASLVICPGIGRAQQPVPVIGYLSPESPGPYASRLRAFRDGLAEAGYVEGQNTTVEFRWAEGRYDQLPALAADLVRRRVSVIVASGGAPTALAAKSATTAIPIVFEMGGDPVRLGVVGSLNRPEGNLTGVSSLSVEASLKRLELLKELLPDATILGAVMNPTSPTAASQLRNLQAGSARLGVQLRVLQAGSEADLSASFAAATQPRIDGLVFASDPFFAFRSQLLADLALRHRLPAITQSRDFTAAGGCMSYGGDFMQSHRQSGLYAGRILRGERPGDLPVQLVTRLELSINATAARRLGIAVPLALVARADEVIE